MATFDADNGKWININTKPLNFQNPQPLDFNDPEIRQRLQPSEQSINFGYDEFKQTIIKHGKDIWEVIKVTETSLGLVLGIANIALLIYNIKQFRKGKQTL